MRIAAVIMLAACLQVSAKTFSQKVNLKLKNASLEQVFNEIKAQTGLYVIWDEQVLRNTKPIDIAVKDASVEDVLKQVFANQPLSYALVGKMIVVQKREIYTVSPIDGLFLKVGQNQLIHISGIVLDEQGAPIANASVQIKGTSNGTATSDKGEFQLTSNEKSVVIVISSLGYAKREITVSGNERLRIVLKKEEQDLDKVVVSTGIFNRKVSSYTGAVTVVTRKELQQFGNRNLITSLRNIDPSFNIIESNNFGSNPNKLPEIQIRGNSSLPNVNQLKDDNRTGINTPLVVLDGFETSLQRLLDLNENEVETITLLKDASATAIYGSRGANGVVVVKTRAPQAGKLRISYKGDLNIEVPDIRAYNLLNAKDKLELERRAGLYDAVRPETDLALKRYYANLLNDVNSGVETDWLSKPLRSGIGQRHNLRLEGGDDRFRYSASAQHNDIQGVMKGSYRKMFNGSINLTYNFKKFRFTNNLIIGLARNAESPYGNFNTYVKMNPYWKATDDKGNILKLLGDYGGTDHTERWRNLPGNPLYNATLNSFDKDNATEIINNLSVEWRLHPDLVLRGSLGLARSNQESDNYKPAAHTDFQNYTGADIFRKGSYTYGINKNTSYEGGLNLSYNRTINRHSFFAGADYRISERSLSNYEFVAEGFTNPNFDFLSMAQQYKKDGKPTGAEGFVRAVGFTGNFNYTWDNRYYFDLSGRMDGSSQFGSKNRFAPFWSTGIGWNLHRERFIQDLTYIDRLKLRGSMGMTGSQNFSSYQALSTFRYYTDQRYFNWMGASLLGLGNENLKWQQKMNYDIGLEGSLLNNRISFVADYYVETTNGLISSVDMPLSNGFSSYIENIGKVRNRGFEVKLTTVLIRNKDFSWSITGAMISNQNKIVEISDALKQAQKSNEEKNGALPVKLYKEGYSDRTIWVVPSLGIDPSTGKEMYLDKTGNPSFVWSSADIRACGIDNPKYQGNLNTLVRYRSFALNMSFGYRFGGQMYNQTLIEKVENADFRYNVDRRVYENRWQKPGDNAAFKGLLVTTATNKTSRFVQDERTFTCQNINLMYELRNQKLLQKFGAEFFSLTANFSDVFYISSVKRERGIDYPFSRQCSFTLNVTF
ncbi:MAG: SusC/RagA family TonB-linked outer membrane protein [Chitinophagaceae bacterium]|nr:SusC/RagA family TonB-linked outer membrane protein [Chitinophagaceae bacterium]